MCTLIIATRVAGGPDVFVAANRDEALDRPAELPSIHHRQGTKILAPRDAKAGGTWLGLNEHGLFSAITNRFRQVTMAHHRSRGELVFRALESARAEEAAERIAALSAADYTGFHLVMADAESAHIVWNDGTILHHHRLEPGFHVVTERSFGAAPSQRLLRTEERVAQMGEWSDDTGERIESWMKSHDPSDSLEGLCIHIDDVNYGTRSSTVVEVGQTWRFAHASGPPCQWAYEEYDEALRRLR